MLQQEKRIWPRIKLRGNDWLKRCGIIYTQILGDLLMKVDDGEGGYPKGFMHTSTTPFTEPNYYNDMWSRDVGRGIMELVRNGFLQEAHSVSDFILQTGMNFGNHYGRLIERVWGAYEVDGNVNLLLAFYMLWKYDGCPRDEGKRFLNQLFPVFEWFSTLIEESPYDGLLKSKSELSGNPEADYFIYAVFATYGAAVACQAFSELAQKAGNEEKFRFIQTIQFRLEEGLRKNLISRGPEGNQNSKTKKGVWLNGIDSRTGQAAEEGDLGPKFDIHRWTRQLPFILKYDVKQVIFREDKSPFDSVNQATYLYLKEGMIQGYYFRRYGFVSNTCFGGMGGRHDDTMAGYGQNYFTQAALLNDDVNCYTKCLEGISRLAYDGDVVAPLTPDLNPWVMHECFCYSNYEKGLDHTFGVEGCEEKQIMHNPGDEGNLVQSAETLKTFAIVAGITARGAALSVMPRLPWECSEAVVKDFPVPSPKGLQRISYHFVLDREENRFILKITGVKDFKTVNVRIGPLPNVLFAEKEIQKNWTLTRRFDAVFAEQTFSVKSDEITAQLINQY